AWCRIWFSPSLTTSQRPASPVKPLAMAPGVSASKSHTLFASSRAPDAAEMQAKATSRRATRIEIGAARLAVVFIGSAPEFVGEECGDLVPDLDRSLEVGRHRVHRLRRLDARRRLGRLQERDLGARS